MKSLIPDSISIQANLQILSLLEMTGSVRLYIESLKENIKDDDELVQLDEVKDISIKLSTIGLYMVVERATKRIFEFLYYDDNESSKKIKLRSLYKWEYVVSELGLSAKIDMSDVDEFSTIRELRCLNNAIKHNGYVDTELAVFSLWKNEYDKEIRSALIDLERYGEAIPKFIYDLAYRIKKSLPAPS